VAFYSFRVDQIRLQRSPELLTGLRGPPPSKGRRMGREKGKGRERGEEGKDRQKGPPFANSWIRP